MLHYLRALILIYFHPVSALIMFKWRACKLYTHTHTHTQWANKQLE